MSHVEVPVERLSFFQTKLGLTSAEISSLQPYQDTFLVHRDEFAEYLHNFLLGIPEMSRIVELMELRGGLRRNWRCWYEGLFTNAFSPRFYELLWTSGLNHVSRNVDQRFIHLGYCVARLFLGDIIERQVGSGDRYRVRMVVDKMIDQCLLVATDAFLADTTQCDREVINGIAHQVRNPLTVIGGFIRNLRKRTPLDSPVQSVLDTMFQETERLESMVQDVGTYIEIMQHEPEFTSCSLDTILREASRRLADGGWTTPVAQELVGAKGLALDADPHLLRSLFYHLLQNGVEAVQGVEKPIVSVTARAEGVPSPVNLRVEVFNNGPVPAADELEHLFTPFYSSNPTGTGFGLPIAALVARKIQAEIDLTAIPGEGTCVTVILPLRRN